MLERTKRISDFVSKILSFGGEVCIGALVVLVSYSSLSRYVFGQGVYFMGELGGLLLMAICFSAFAYVFSIGRHVKVSFITNKLPKAVRDWGEVAACIVSLIYFVIFIKLSLDFVYMSYLIDCHSADACLYEVPWMAIMPTGIIACAIVVLIFGIDKFRSIVTKSEEKAGEEEVIVEKFI